MLVGAYFHQCKLDAQEKQHFRIMVPTGIAAQPGMRVTLFPKDLWDKVLKNEKLEKSDAERLDSLTLKLNFMPCRPEGCAAEMGATPDLLGLKRSGGLMVYAITESGASIALQVPLAGFARTLEGEPFQGIPRPQEQWRQEVMRCVERDWPDFKRP